MTIFIEGDRNWKRHFKHKWFWNSFLYGTDILGLLGGYFKLLWIKDAFEDPVVLYLICSRKKPSNRPANVLNPEKGVVICKGN